MFSGCLSLKKIILFNLQKPCLDKHKEIFKDCPKDLIIIDEH